MNYLYRRLAHNELANHKLDDYEVAFMDVEDYESGLTPELDKMIDSLNYGDTVDFESMAELGITAETILNVLEQLAEKHVSIRFQKHDLLIEHHQIESSVSILKAFYEAGLVNESGFESFQERKKLDQAREAAVLKGDRLEKALSITRAHLIERVEPKQLAKVHGVGIATVYRYIKKYTAQVQMEIKDNGE
ncbi:recombinase family protein [Vibrio tubiashii]|uniref:Resolvase n=1 Tax=Vibrio tubiashii ATCC 19109 TaxID=1051646 RepID=F9T6P2_9VIBR|nr:recombinase family protein [Vibrio tubiashii]AIW17518.1 resolvase [Vibrio tubiashii ATCC 19109]EGU54447.1 hypothetical protein VITU9109_02697 [Vibrio tubiashii ATCC 19109]